MSGLAMALDDVFPTIAIQIAHAYDLPRQRDAGCDDGRLRLVISGKAMSLGNREILFDQEGRETAAGTLVGEFRRPNWLKGVS